MKDESAMVSMLNDRMLKLLVVFGILAAVFCLVLPYSSVNRQCSGSILGDKMDHASIMSRVNCLAKANDVHVSRLVLLQYIDYRQLLESESFIPPAPEFKIELYNYYIMYYLNTLLNRNFDMLALEDLLKIISGISELGHFSYTVHSIFGKKHKSGATVETVSDVVQKCLKSIQCAQ